MDKFKVPFAYDEFGDIVDIQSAIKGSVYTCNCGGEVKLRGGNIVSDHFYHISESKCSYESAIHKAYKDVFQKVKGIKLPYKVNGQDFLKFDKVEVEKQIDNYIPDAIGYIGCDMYLIEFAKTSYIGERKLKKIKKSNLLCIEVDIIVNVKSIDHIKDHLVKDRMYKHIIHIPEYKEMAEMRENFKKAYRKLESENRRLRSDLATFKELTSGDAPLFFVTDCKNGAKMYQRRIDGRYDTIVAFQKGKTITLKR